MLSVFISLTSSCLAYSGPSGAGASVLRVTPTKVLATAEPKFPRLNIDATYGIENEYQLNLGRAIDTLRRDYPNILSIEPDFTIFSKNIRLSGDSSERKVEGLKAYKRVFEVLRFMRNTTMVHDEIGTRVVVHDGTIRVRWNAKLTMQTAFGALPGLGTRDESGRPLVFVDGVSVYEVNATGFIFSHRLEDIEVTPPELQGAVDLALFAWPGGFSPPVAAVPSLSVQQTVTILPTVDTLAFSVGGGSGLNPPARGPDADADAATDVLLTVKKRVPLIARASIPLRRRPAEVRAPAPVASAGETPMERAARERAEDAEVVQRRRELSTPAAKGGGGFFSNLFSADLSGPQSCETNYDCEAPLVCCDLVVASVCCSSGMFVGPPPQMQRQLIPIPIPVDDDSPRGGAADLY